MDVAAVVDVGAAVFLEAAGECLAVVVFLVEVAAIEEEAVIEVADIVVRHPCRVHHRAHHRSTVQAAVVVTRVHGPAMAICQHREVGQVVVRVAVLSRAVVRAAGRGPVASRAVGLVQGVPVPVHDQASFPQAATYKTFSTFQRQGVLAPVVLRRVPVEVMAELWLAAHSRAARRQSS